MKDRERTERLAVFDPLAGPLIDSIVLDMRRQESQRNVVFADGETGQSLCEWAPTSSHRIHSYRFKR
jgi:hypothetical protein